LFQEGIVDQIIPEPDEGAHTNHDEAARFLDVALTRQLAEAVGLSLDERLTRRYAKLRKFGRWGTATE
jgi:acetyl-CoA carboxylase alpha subunit